MWMQACVGQVLEAQRRAPPTPPRRPRLLIAGASGMLGSEVAQRLIGARAWAPVTVLTREPMQTALAGMRALDVSRWGDAVGQWPTPEEAQAEVAVVMFEPPRLYHGRERALWTPEPTQLTALSRWLHGAGVRELAVLIPHTAGRLPDALQRGLASLDEAEVARLDFRSLLWFRTAQAGARGAPLPLLPRLAHWMLGIFKYMIPEAQRPLRAAPLAVVVDAALRLSPPGVHVIGPALLHAAAQGDARQVLGAAFGLAAAQPAPPDAAATPSVPPR